MFSGRKLALQKSKAISLDNVSQSDMREGRCYTILEAFHPFFMHHPRSNIGADLISSCDELRPADLIASLHLGGAAINQPEFSRVEWFWQRRPKILCADPVIGFCYLNVVVCLFYYLPQTALLLLISIAAGTSCVLVDNFRLTRWRNEYELSIKRAIIRLSDQK